MYCKLFASLYQGTLRGRSHEILVFTNLLATCDKDGIVDKHYRAIAEEVGLKVEEVMVAIKNLESPDEESRSHEMDGARIIPMDEHRDWGWRIVNYLKYRAIRNEDDRREQNRRSQENFRNKNADNKQSKPRSAKVSRDKPPSAHAEALGIKKEEKRAFEGPESLTGIQKAAEEVLGHLNFKTGFSIEANRESLDPIVKRLKQNISSTDLKLVIDFKCKEWISSASMKSHLVPSTLFGTKFSEYLGTSKSNAPKPRLTQAERQAENDKILEARRKATEAA